ncbi:MAG: sodium:proton antiporter [Dehalococcoidia bacterium]
MNEEIMIGLASIIILGIGAQWISWRFQLPSILLLIIMGIIAGPVTGLVEPDKDFGELLLPIISLSVGIILFEGGLNLRIVELRKVGRVIPLLVTVGALITWLVTSLSSYYLLDLGFDVSVLLGAILIVSGPTVVLPLLRQLRPIGSVGPILKWEGTVIDPIGAMLAVLVFEGILTGRLEEASWHIAIGIGRTLFIGGLAGWLGAMLLLLCLRRYWIPDFLQSTVTLATVIAVYAVSGIFQDESGLLATTVMGIVLGNQKTISVRHIAEFKENLGILLISGLFILLTARLQTSDWDSLTWGSLALLAILIFAARPLTVLFSTIRSGLNWREKLFITWMAPRGIVAAAIASVFALRLVDEGYADARLMVPHTFMVIIGTVAFYGLTVFPLSHRLKIANPNPQGFLIVGAHPWAREIASALQAKNFQVLMIDTQWAHLSEARRAGLPTFYASALSQYTLDSINLSGIGRLLALTPNTGDNSLAALHFAPFLGRSNVFQLPLGEESGARKEEVSQHLRGRLLFGSNLTYSYITERFKNGAIVKTTQLTERFDYKAFKSYYGDNAIPMFIINENGSIVVITAREKVTPQAGHTLISLVDPIDESEDVQSTG